MTDIRRTIVSVIFIFSLIMLWDQWQVYNGKPAYFLASNNPTAEQTQGASQEDLGNLDVPKSSGISADGTTLPAQTIVESGTSLIGEKIVVTTDQYKVTFDTVGGKIIELDLLKHVDQNDKEQPVKLINPAYHYEVRTGLTNAQSNAPLPNHNTIMHLVSTAKTMADGQDHLEVRFESDVVNGVRVVKTYTFTRNSYVINVTNDVINAGDVPVTPELYYQLVRNSDTLPGASKWFGGNTFTGPAYYNDDKRYNKVSFSDIDKGTISINGIDGWVAMVQHYFVSAWLLDKDEQRQLFTKKLENNNYSIGMLTPLKTLAPGESVSESVRFYSGPQNEKVLEKLAPGFELVKDYGMFRIFSKPLFWLLHLLNEYIHNWGWSIVALVVLIKAAFFWLNARAYQSMGKMRALSPRLKEINERYKDDPQQKQRETMRIYKEEKINPLGGCLPILIQIPVFIALYWVLLSSVEMRNAPWVGWITDLSVKDPYFILPAVMAASTMLQTWLNPKPADPTQAKMMWMMPLMFSVMFFMFPAGLVLYWVTNNLLSIAQQWFINNKLVAKAKS